MELPGECRVYHGWKWILSLPGPGAERARGERTRAHPDAPQWWRHVAEKIAAAGAAAIVGDRARNIYAQPMAASFTQRIDALHGQAGQVLHSFTSVAAWPGQLRSYLEHVRRRIAEVPWAALLFAAAP